MSLSDDHFGVLLPTKNCTNSLNGRKPHSGHKFDFIFFTVLGEVLDKFLPGRCLIYTSKPFFFKNGLRFFQFCTPFRCMYHHPITRWRMVSLSIMGFEQCVHGIVCGIANHLVKQFHEVFGVVKLPTLIKIRFVQKYAPASMCEPTGVERPIVC